MAKCLARANILFLGGEKENANADCIALMTKSSRLFIKSAYYRPRLFNMMDWTN